MQTFLPVPCFYESAHILDNKRLGKQRVEAYQIVKAIRGEYAKAWVNHPATVMWREHEEALLLYGKVMCAVWRERGFADSLYEFFDNQGVQYGQPEMPWWFGDSDFHLSHRSNLMRKDPAWYGRQFAGMSVPDDLPYLWPKAERYFIIGATGVVRMPSALPAY